VTLAASTAPPDSAAKTLALETSARELAESHGALERAPGSQTRFVEATQVAEALEYAQWHLAATPADDSTLPRAAEWFLDNYYLIRRVARQIGEDLPRGFARHLPWVATAPGRGAFRVDLLARELIATTKLELDPGTLRRFVAAYQDMTPLTIAELWALPTMLRTCVLRHLVRFLERLHVPVRGESDHGDPAPDDDHRVTLDPGVGVEYAIRALRLLDVVDWKAFFAKANRVEAILTTDPAGVYPRMDFQTCDSYRRVIEALAWSTGRAEHDVADLAIALAAEPDGDERHRHVGHYLVSRGRSVLERRLGYRPVGLARVRRAVTRWPTLSYLMPLALLTAIPLFALGWILARAAMPAAMIAAAVAVAAIPVSVVTVALCQAVFARLLSPRTLPKLDFAKGLTADVRTLVAIPTLLGRVDDVTEMLRQLELHYLSNPDPQLQFALLTDDVDSKTPPSDTMLLDLATRGIEALNAKHGTAGRGPFHLLHREARWNPSEQRYMGWERKRGKLEELNRLLRGDRATSYARQVGDPEGLAGVRFVITLDSDTQLPMGTAQKLVGVLAHPLNQAETDPRTGRVIAGYTIVQPRVETSPTSSRQTWFAQLFAGDTGFDIYTHAVSELYQDLFGSGIYVGKGIYDVDTFMRSVEGRVPENALVSHDLFEGVHGRTALATDIVLFEGYPSSYPAYSKRMHRWMRGDWQLSPWLFPRVPSFGGDRVRNRLAGIDRWKILDNLRRSLTNPAVLLLLLLGWTWLPGPPLAWTLAAIVLLLAPLLPGVARGGHLRMAQLARCALAVVFLAHESAIVVDAIVRVVVRAALTRRHMLQWTTAANAELGVARASPRALSWRTVGASPALAGAIAALVAWARPSALLVAAPLLASWLAAPEIAAWVSKPRRSRVEPLRPDERKYLRVLAHRTWRFFDAFVGPGDQWLPIDNYQAEPHEQTAHRTSPTNIGLMLVSTLSAYDFGYLGPSELSLRVRGALDSIARLAHYQGHLLNWYDTRSLQPLLPRYVSTVDSGNFAGCLIALAQGCREIASSPVVRAEAWQGLADSLDLLEDVIASIPGPGPGPGPSGPDRLAPLVEHMRAAAERGRANPADAYPTLSACDATAVELDREVLGFVEAGEYRHDVDLLHALRESINWLHRQLRQIRRDLDALLPWVALGDEPAAHAIALPTQLRLDEIPAAAERLGGDLQAWREDQRRREQLTPELDASAQRIADALQRGRDNAVALHAELIALAARANEEVHGMDFRLLYDAERKLFRIGYNVTADHHDANHYDLLASEARLASYLAIVRREVPEAHWYTLGRPMTSVAGTPALLSWGGTMFEYLMPNLLMRSHEGTLLARTGELVVEAQIAWGQEHGEPWGVSESAFAQRDAAQTYQYRSFGVPGLGFKRGLDDDHVVTPYASALAISIRPRDVVANLMALEAMGMHGSYGLFEALDLTPERASEGTKSTVVRSYMAHHQGMLFVALGNLLNDRSMVDRFHADPVIATGELLLDERAPHRAPAEWPLAEADNTVDAELALPHPPGPWSSADPSRPQAFVLGNGRLTSLVTDSGGGGLAWHGLALTRYQPDPTCDTDGVWIYVRDEASQRVWLATSPQGRTSYAMHKIELHRRIEGISVHVDVAVAAADDVEVRQITLHNETDRPRRLTVTSAGRPVLVAQREAPVHPAFSSMFVVSEALTELDALMFARRHKSPEETPVVLVHRLVREGAAVSFAGYETDRAAFYGRCASLRAPAALAAPGPLRGRAGAVLDPVMSLMANVELEPNATLSFAFVTAVGRSRTAAVELARRYGSMHAVRWAFRDAELESPRRLQRTSVESELVPSIQRLFSGLLFADPALRARSTGGAAARPSKRRLWGHGISGDDPIVLVRVHDSNAPVLRETLSAQRYLRACGIRVDLVLIDEQATGYASDGSGTLRRVLAQHDDHSWIGHHGGIYLLTVDQTPEGARRHLEAAARVVLDTRDGSLAARLDRIVEPAARLPRFEPTASTEITSPAQPRPSVTFDNGTGGFTVDGREYVISIAPGGATPAPWCNVLANEQFGCLASESVLGVTWSVNSGENKLTPWRNDPVFDTPAEVLYLRDEETAAVWSPTPLPAGRASATTVRHGAGYTTYERASHGLEQALTVFVPPNAPLKIVRLRIKNVVSRHRRLTATYYAEWVLGPRRADQAPFVTSEHDPNTGALLATCSWDSELADRVAFVVARNKLHGYTTDRLEFLGRGGDYARPAALERWGLSGSIESGTDPCAALQIHLELAPGEQLETHFVLGQAAHRDQALELVARFRDPTAVDTAWAELGAFWDQLLGAVRVATPEPAMDIMLNRWLLYQAVSSRLVGRIGFYQASGAYGFRDQLQDVLALLHVAPERTRAHILEAAAHQFEQGDVLHWWHPPSGRGVRTRCSDDLLWLVFVTAEYVAATGDAAILDEPIPFLTGEPLGPDEHDRYAQYEPSHAAASLLEHCRRALEQGATEGAHGLPLMGDGDWNDGMNRVGAEGHGESVWLGWFLCAVMERFAALCTRTGDPAAATRWRADASALRGKIADSAWDGAWYLRAFHDDGSLIGSAKNRECRIDSIAQSWAVLSRAPDARPDARARAAVAAADDQLVREADRLVLLSWPPFDSTVHDPGYIRAYPPGIRENGGQYTHAATWLGWAHAALGDGERATRIFRLLNPILRSETAAASLRYRVEPYVLAADVYSCPPWVGRGGWTWYTGSAAWMWRLGIEAILGLRRSDGELHIEPCIPPAWKGFEAWVQHGAQQLHIVVENPDRVSTGIAAMTLDGAALDAHRIRLDPTATGVHEVRVRLGSQAIRSILTHSA
jgi:cyclic beta-1,2-glucan synthetase